MSDNNDHKEQRLGLWIVGGAAGLATAATLLFSVWGWENGEIEGSPTYGQAASAVVAEGEAAAVAASEAVVAVETAPADVAPMEAAASEAAVGASTDEAAVVVENGIVKFYFASGKADLAEGAEAALQDVLAGVKEGKKAVVSGFHDATGNQALNEQLSKERAFAVKNALIGFGVPEDQIELRKPEDSEGSGDNAEARRVEVVLE